MHDETQARRLERLRQNRSFVIRTTRMSDHQKAAYDRLSPTFCVPVSGSSPRTPLDWNDVFPHRRSHGGGSRPLVMDIGFGMGGELAELAERRRDTDFLGVEVHKPGVGKLLGHIERLSLENVRIIRHDAVVVCDHLIPEGSLDGVHLFFPDPWPKKRHNKRRLVREGFPDLVAPLLKGGGYLYAVTDWEEYAHQMLDVLTGSSLLTNRYDRFAAPQSWRPQTAFERKGLQQGHTIFEVLFERPPEAYR